MLIGMCPNDPNIDVTNFLCAFFHYSHVNFTIWFLFFHRFQQAELLVLFFSFTDRNNGRDFYYKRHIDSLRGSPKGRTWRLNLKTKLNFSFFQNPASSTDGSFLFFQCYLFILYIFFLHRIQQAEPLVLPPQEQVRPREEASGLHGQLFLPGCVEEAFAELFFFASLKFFFVSLKFFFFL